MGWIGDLVKGISSADTVAFVVTDALPCDGMELDPQPLEPDTCYIELFVDALWLPKARQLTSDIHGVVHVFSRLERLGGERAEIAYISAPTDLAKVDGRSVNRVVIRSRKALGPVPWRGQNLDLEIGLFSVKSSDLTAPYLDLMGALSNQAGVNFLLAAAPFVPIVRKGMELLTGRLGASSLEIGLDTTLSAPRTGRYAIVAADRQQINEARLSIARDGSLLLDRALLRSCPWLVFRIEKSTQRADFGSIPELKDAWSKLMAAIRSRKRWDAEEAFTICRVTAVTSPDLIPADAEAITTKASEILQRAFAAAPQKRGQLLKPDSPTLASFATPELDEIDLYGKRMPPDLGPVVN